MVKIEELLTPGESVIKKQGGVTVGKGVSGMPAGDLFLTNMRLLFIHKKRWALVSLVPGAALMGKDIQIPLENIKTVKKGVGTLKVQATTPTTPLKEYQFMVSVWKAGGWVDAIQQAMGMPPHPPTHPQAQQPQLMVRRFCPSCGSPVKPEDKFCGSCRAKLQ